MQTQKQKIALIVSLSVGGLIIVMNLLQTLYVSDRVKKSVADEYVTHSVQITNAYSLAIANKINEYMGQMRFYSDADVVATGNDKLIVEWLRNHVSSRRAFFLLLCMWIKTVIPIKIPAGRVLLQMQIFLQQ